MVNYYLLLLLGQKCNLSINFNFFFLEGISVTYIKKKLAIID